MATPSTGPCSTWARRGELFEPASRSLRSDSRAAIPAHANHSRCGQGLGRATRARTTDSTVGRLDRAPASLTAITIGMPGHTTPERS